MPSRHDKPGSSLIELMIAITLIGILMSLLASNTTFLYRYITQSEIDLLFSRMKYAQQHALLTGTMQRMIFDTDKNRYLWGDEVYQLPASIAFKVLPGIQGPPSSPTKPLTSAITFAHQTSIFYPDGIISAGTLYLVDMKHKALYAISCGVSQVSFLRKYRYDGKWHLIAS